MGEGRSRLLTEAMSLLNRLDRLQEEYLRSGIGEGRRRNTGTISKRISAGAVEQPRMADKVGRALNITDPSVVAYGNVPRSSVPALANMSVRPIGGHIDLDERIRALGSAPVPTNTIRLSPTAQLMTQSTPTGANRNIQHSVGSSQSTVFVLPDEPEPGVNYGRGVPEGLSRPARPQSNESRPDGELVRNDTSAIQPSTGPNENFGRHGHSNVPEYSQINPDHRIDNRVLLHDLDGEGRPISPENNHEVVAVVQRVVDGSTGLRPGRGDLPSTQRQAIAAEIRSYRTTHDSVVRPSRIPSPVDQDERWRREGFPNMRSSGGERTRGAGRSEWEREIITDTVETNNNFGSAPDLLCQLEEMKRGFENKVLERGQISLGCRA